LLANVTLSTGHIQPRPSRFVPQPRRKPSYREVSTPATDGIGRRRVDRQGKDRSFVRPLDLPNAISSQVAVSETHPLTKAHSPGTPPAPRRETPTNNQTKFGGKVLQPIPNLFSGRHRRSRHWHAGVQLATLTASRRSCPRLLGGDSCAVVRAHPNQARTRVAEVLVWEGLWKRNVELV
jgi:hypothetical protein